MVGQASSLATPFGQRTGLVWGQTPEATIAKITAELPPPQQWRQFLDQLRPSSKPLLLWLRGRIWFGSTGRAELARSIGSSTVALIVDDDIGRGLATALRWLGSDVSPFDIGEIDKVDAALGLEPGVAYKLLQRLMR